MYGKLYILLAILCIVIAVLANGESASKKGESAGNSKKAATSQSKDKAEEKNDDDDDDDGFDIELPGQGSQRYSPFQLYDIYGRYRPRGIGAPTNDGSTCHPLFDEQYPVFSNMCGAVPQARYSLPNTFGHNDRWQLSYILTTVMGSVTDPTCVRLVRNLICPMLFQPCRQRHEPPLVLPCQYYCRAVKAQCAIPALDVIPCELLPYGSDLCPNIEALPQTTAPTTQPQPATENLLAARAYSNVPTAQTPAPSAPASTPSTQQAAPTNANNRPPQATYQIRSQFIPPPGYLPSRPAPQLPIKI